MIDLINIGFHFGGRYLYRNVNWSIKPGDRIGLVGKNGTGKTTLLKIITNEYTASEGELQKQRDTTIGFLNQEHLSFQSEESIKMVAMQAFSRQLQLQKEIDEIIAKMETEYTDDLIHQLGERQDEFQQLDGYTIESKTEEILEGLGFSTEDLDRPLKEFSGGWRMRVMLGKLLLQNPSVLMLDEPTNHLDLPSIEWLEQYLQGYQGAIIVVSHDRYFLDRLINKTVEVAMEKVTIYPGNYSYFLEERAQRSEIHQKAYENQQAYIRQQERFIERFKAKASKATAAQSRVKQLDKLERIEAVETDDARIDLRFPVKRSSGKIVSKLEHITKNFGALNILTNASAEIQKGDKIALIGANGRGKSTLLRIISNTEQFEGKSELGYNVDTAFYAQHQLEALHLNRTLLEELQYAAPLKTEQELRTILGCFLFTGDDVFKKIKVLSGGEKARVALAKTLLLEANFMELDEPTNHLDMQSINILINALQEYEGSFIVVSHDRYFVSNIANKIWWIEDHQLKEYPGTYEEYVYWHENVQVKEKSAADKKIKKEKEKTASDSSQPENEAKERQKEIKKLKDEVAAIEKKQEELKQKISKLENELYKEDVLKNNELARKLNEEMQGLKNTQKEMNLAFEECFGRLIELEA